MAEGNQREEPHRPNLAPSDAQRLARLRVLMGDARRRAGDESELGLHLAVIAIDGVGELAIGLCVAHLGIALKKGQHTVPGRLGALIEELAIAPPGRKGYLELHRARNSVQHEGILPLAEQLPLWLAETEQLVDALVAASFEVGLDAVRSADGVADADLRGLLEEAEDLLQGGDAPGSFDRSWSALEEARREFRQKTGLHRMSPTLGVGHGSVIGMDDGLKSVAAELGKLSGEMEVSAFTAEPGEWLWFRQRQGELFGRGPAPTRAEAGRAFVFALGWILRYESYISRHGVDRWERLREEARAPVTGVPGGPHIAAVGEGERLPRRRGEGEARNWIFELTDVPDSEPSFEWAVREAFRRPGAGWPLVDVWLGDRGRLSVTFQPTLTETDLLAAVRELFQAAKEILHRRAEEDAEDEGREEELLAPFREGLARASCPFCEIDVMMPRGRDRIDPEEASIRIVVPGPEEGPSLFAKGLEEGFSRHFPEPTEAPGEYRRGFDHVVVPAGWDPEQVGRWVKDAVAHDEEARQAERDGASAKAAEEARALEEMRRILEDG
jgi:hypothetical protein